MDLLNKQSQKLELWLRGSITEDKLIRLSAWIKRHLDDVRSEAVKKGEIHGVVAHWLWGSGSANISVEDMIAGANRTMIGRIEKSKIR